ncbi:MAG TPA: NAD(P)-binding domain-containing protein [Chitinophagaceae bacterium]|nr:NAD(P)-binding domain-containing protein [Chitinophagaceae bacterium]MCB9054606.1 NAD(P)-binding domain-containing protein [Chitinophagales bacterium]HPG10382.1 NAD(P)-binding domain-containing protein [Chitinophagaceae bacterium]HRX92762.1 NAD(P)-binding domain-containing protein [Chitinophagaceae bacterium]
MKIGIVGSGIVGRVLASGFLQEGHEVMLGTRNVSKEDVIKWQKENPSGLLGSFQETAQFGEVVVLAVSGLAVEDAIELAGKEHFFEKIVIDATNPIAAVPPDNGVLKFFTTLEESLMERIQNILPDAKLVKAFNSVGNAHMYKPSFPDGTPTMFICGNDEKAKKTVTGILTSFGWETEDMGTVEAARAIEPLCILWCIPGFIHNKWNHAFKLLKA